MTITEEAPPQVGEPRARPAAWWWLVAVCTLILLVVGVTLAVWWALSRETRTTSYRVLGELAAIRLDLGDAAVEIAGGASAVEVRRVDRFAFGEPSRERHEVVDGALTVTSRCPDQVLGSCHVAFRVAVPDNVPIEVETADGDVRLNGVRASVSVSTGAGAIAATGFCGFLLRAGSDSGHIRAASECSADRFELRSRTGNVRAIVPGGRYQIDAQSDTGQVRIVGLTNVDDAPFQIQALSTEGDVTVEAAS